MNDVLELDVKPVKIMHEDCLDCGEKFDPLPYDVYGAIGGFFCEECIKKDFPDEPLKKVGAGHWTYKSCDFYGSKEIGYEIRFRDKIIGGEKTLEDCRTACDKKAF
jgi:hypothetical protein